MNMFDRVLRRGRRWVCIVTMVSENPSTERYCSKKVGVKFHQVPQQLFFAVGTSEHTGPAPRLGKCASVTIIVSRTSVVS